MQQRRGAQAPDPRGGGLDRGVHRRGAATLGTARTRCSSASILARCASTRAPHAGRRCDDGTDAAARRPGAERRQRGVDRFTRNTGGAATLFVRKGDDFVRVATSLKDDRGQARARHLARRRSSGAGAAARRQALHGRALLFGREYIVKYEPMRRRRRRDDRTVVHLARLLERADGDQGADHGHAGRQVGLFLRARRHAGPGAGQAGPAPDPRRTVGARRSRTPSPGIPTSARSSSSRHRGPYASSCSTRRATTPSPGRRSRCSTSCPRGTGWWWPRPSKTSSWRMRTR